MPGVAGWFAGHPAARRADWAGLAAGTCVAALFAAEPVSAGPDACSGSGSSTITCSGDQSDGVVIGTGGMNADNANTIEVRDLSGPIEGARGVLWDISGSNNQSDIKVNVGSQPVTGTAGAGIRVTRKSSSSGRVITFNPSSSVTSLAGSEGALSFVATGKNGSGGSGDGGSGGDGWGGPTGAVVLGSLDGAEDVLGVGTGNPAIFLSTLGGTGGNAAGAFFSDAGNGGVGGAGGALSVTLGRGWTLGTQGGNTAPVIRLLSTGGDAGSGGWSTWSSGGHGGWGGIGGAITVTAAEAGSVIRSSGSGNSDAPGILAVSTGGRGGDGGTGESFGDGGSGSQGGAGGAVTVGGGSASTPGVFDIVTEGARSDGISAQSIGGIGGDGGDGGVFTGGGGSGGNSGTAGAVTVSAVGSIVTGGDEAYGILAHSVAGHGGNGGSGRIVFSAEGGSAGNGGAVGVTNVATITTRGEQAPGISALSSGGGGGHGGSAFGVFFAGGSSGGNGGAGGAVTIDNSGAVTTAGNDSTALYAQSIGGVGGEGGSATGLVALGGRAGNSSAGGKVTVTNSAPLRTGTDPDEGGGSDPTCGTGCSAGILAQSIGGGGGVTGGTADGGSSAGLVVSLGGTGGGGGAGGAVSVLNSAAIETALANSDAIAAQSIGGGGGKGGGSVSFGVGASAAIGGSGGNGGTAGPVSALLTGSAALTTTGDHSAGLRAQSIGGGGGAGAFAVAAAVGGGDIPATAAAIGGTGGKGGKGASASANTDAATQSIATTGDHATGILAQSVGGGGGSGGWSVAAAGSQMASAALGIGGGGGSGGAGGDATISSLARVTTAGDNAAGLFAQSIGGGGGNGGFGAAASIADGGSVSLGIGGSGGGAGGAAGASVYNSGIVGTAGDAAPVISAQSIGGGGGTGGMALSGTLNLGAAGAAVAVGGTGGSGGAGGEAYVDSQGALTSRGENSHGILAQSVGGGGGDAGLTLSGALNLGSDSTGVSMSIGASGGSGGSADDTTVINKGSITATGGGAAGIIAQSIGGGGGTGATSLSGTLTGQNSKSFSLALGGAGGAAGDGGTVLVTNSGQISTGVYTAPSYDTEAPTGAHGILAQSVGGGGGSASLAGALSTQADAEEKATNFSVTIGGSGGSAGKGGSVSIGNTASVTTLSDGSHAVFGQSVGGSGGSGGAAVSVSFELLSTPESEVQNIGIAVGGKGGDGSTGGVVTLANSATILTRGALSHGLYAQSVGGSGGDGGSARTMAHTYTGEDDPKDSEGARAVQVGVGGNGGKGTNGGAVTLTSGAGVTTEGDGSIALLGQSIGGGGGNGGNAAAIKTQGKDRVKEDNNYKIFLGGSGNLAGSGGAVEVDHTAGDITTKGYAAPAILAQSVGGGGGTAGSGSISVKSLYEKTGDKPKTDLDVLIGGIDGAEGDGGDVTVKFSGGAILTEGAGDEVDPDDPTTGIDNSYGILAQSVGGGGGVAGNASFFGTPVAVEGNAKEGLTIGIGLGLDDAGAGSGEGGSVSVEADGDITTRGANGIAILAQSVGGGGGIGGDTGMTYSNEENYALIGSTGGVGAGGLVGVVSRGAVSTAGAGAHGIFAQSAGGNGSGAVSVTAVGDVIAAGSDAYGIFAQSATLNDTAVIGGAAVSVTVGAGARVQGGVASPNSTAAAIRVANGTNVTISNAGTLTSVAGVEGYAIEASGLSNVVENTGVIIGQVSAVNTKLALRNTSSGVLATGETLDLGSGGTLTNAGTIIVGGAAIGSTRVTGTLAQTETGRIRLTLDPVRGKADRLEIEGAADLSGHLAVDLVDALVGSGEIAVLSATEGLSAAALAPVSTVAARYALAERTSGELTLGYDIDFASGAILGDLTREQGSVASALGRIHRDTAVPDGFRPLLEVETLSGYGALLDALGPRAYAVSSDLAHLSARDFLGRLPDCARLPGARLLADGVSCLGVSLSRSDFDDDDDDYGADTTSVGLVLSRPLGDGNGQVSAAIGYDHWSASDNGGSWSSRADQVQAGVAARWPVGPVDVSAAVAGGIGSARVDRERGVMFDANGDQDLWFLGGAFRVDRDFDFGNWFLRATGVVDTIHVDAGSVRETGGGPGRLEVDGSAETLVSFTPEVTLGGTIALPDGATALPRLRLGLRHYLTDPGHEVTARFSAFDTDAGFMAVSGLDRTTIDIGSEIEILSNQGSSLSIGAYASAGPESTLYGGAIMFRNPF